MGATTVYNSIIYPNIKEHMKKIEELEKEAHKGLEKGIERVRGSAKWEKKYLMFTILISFNCIYIFMYI